jgi:hypothetical protein
MWKIWMQFFRSKTKILGIFTPFRCSKTSIWFRTTSFMSKTHVLGGFMPFHCRTRPIVKISIGVHLMHEFMPPKPFLILSQPTHYFRSKTHVLVGSMPFRSRTWHVAKTGIEVHLMHEFMPLDLFLVFLQQKCPIHYFRSKTHVLDGFVPFCSPTRPVANICIGEHLMHEFVPRKPFSCLAETNMLNPQL